MSAEAHCTHTYEASIANKCTLAFANNHYVFQTSCYKMVLCYTVITEGFIIAVANFLNRKMKKIVISSYWNSHDKFLETYVKIIGYYFSQMLPDLNIS